MTNQQKTWHENYFPLVIDALRALNFSATPKEVYNWILENHLDKVSEESLHTKVQSGQSKFRNQVQWVRYYLSADGLIGSDQRGIWTLTGKGREAKLSAEDIVALIRRVNSSIRQANSSRLKKKEKSSIDGADNNQDDKSSLIEESAPSGGLYINETEIRERLVEILRTLEPKEFEKLCARLLERLGFESVKVTGKSGDKGIDGEGYLTINKLVRTKVAFQCKRYSEDTAVTPKEVREFLGAIQGHVERGIFLTTGTFTAAARLAADEGRGIPIELVDVENLCNLIIEEKFGIAEKQALVVDEEFFSPYQAVI